jgi:hypothetical protein
MAETQESGTIVKDGELAAINAIVKQLAKLDDAGRRQVLNYVNGRFPAEQAKE